MNRPESLSTKVYRFDDILVDAESFRVTKAGDVIALTPRAFDVLILLLQRSGGIVERRELFEEVWKDTFVTDNALSKIVKELRHAFSDSADDPKYIETVPKRGYRFIGTLKESDGGDKLPPAPSSTNGDVPTFTNSDRRPNLNPKLLVLAALAVAAMAIGVFFQFFSTDAGASRTSIAVLPFKPLVAESRDESLEMGMAETLITRLSGLRQVTVRSLSSVSRYTDPQLDPVEVGKASQVDAVLDGTIQRSGDRIRVTVRLINISDGATLWSELFDDSFTDIFKVQDSIAERVTNALTLQLSRQEKEQLAKHYTDSPKAYQLYLQGQYLRHRNKKTSEEQSLAYYQQALEEDPNFALAHVEVAGYYTRSASRTFNVMSGKEAAAKAIPSVMRALEIDDTLAEAHNALAELKYQYEYDWIGADAEFKRAIELNPNVAFIRLNYGWFLTMKGRFDEANFEIEKAREFNPSSLAIREVKGNLLYFSRNYDAALQYFQILVADEPNSDTPYLYLAQVYEQKRMYPEASASYLKWLSMDGGQRPELMAELLEALKVSGWQGWMRRELKDVEERAQRGYHSPYIIAHVQARLGQKEQALSMLQKAFDERDPLLVMLKTSPSLDSLRNDPRFHTLLKKLNYPE